LELILAKPSSQEISKGLPGFNAVTFSPRAHSSFPTFSFWICRSTKVTIWFGQAVRLGTTEETPGDISHETKSFEETLAEQILATS